MNEQIERRVAVRELEIRADDGEEPVITGYAAVFNQLSGELFGFREMIRPGAFQRSIREDDVRALWDHESMYVLGRNRAGTLGLWEDDHGLRVSITPPATSWARDLITSMQRGDINQMSFGFFTRDDNWRVENGQKIRDLIDVELFDVSIVTYPAYPQTSAEARDMADSIKTDGGPGAGAADGEDKAEEAGPRARTAFLRRKINLLKKKAR